MQRINFLKIAPGAVQVLRSIEQYVHQSGLDGKMLELVKVRASQINHCAYCIDMHTKDARAAGESEQRLYGLTAWRETPYYSQRERAALAWTEAITRISADQAPDEVYEMARRQFEEKELVDLTMAIIAINSWNRLVIGFRVVPGGYQPPALAKD